MKKDAPAASRILLVDKNARGLATRKVILGQEGYSVETALNGEAAWELFENNAQTVHPFDVVVTDIKMNGVRDGLDLIRRIRAADSPVRIVILSSHLVDFDEKTSEADEQISKGPHEVPELLRVLRKMTARPRRRPPTTAKGLTPPKAKSQAV
jgi:CheY-like chemotaxis protein